MLEVTRRKKFPQMIWLDTDTYIKVLEASKKLNVAPNVVCAEVIKRYLESDGKVVEKVVEKVVPRAYLCPGCDHSFDSAEEVRRHLKTNPECLQRMRGLAAV